MERDYKFVYREFDKYARILEAEGIYPPSINSIEYFCKEMITKRYWYYPPAGGEIRSLMFYGTVATDQLTGEPILDRSDAIENDALFAEMREKLMGKVEQSYGGLGNEERLRKWAPNPFTVEERAREYALMENVDMDKWDNMTPIEKQQTTAYQKAVADSIYVKNRCVDYFATVGPFMLRKTMHHPLASIYFSFSVSQADNRKSTMISRKEGVTVDSEKDIEDFMKMKEYQEMRSMGSESFRSLWFIPSTTGDNIKMACIDLDNPQMAVKDSKMKTVVRQVANKLEAEDVPYIIMFTGKSYQIWFGTEKPEINNQYEANRYIEDLFRGIDALVSTKTSISAAEINEAVSRGVPLIDKSVNTKNKPLGMFFGMHYKPQSKPTDDPGTGYVRVPVLLKQLSTFDPMTEAHPDYVLKNFNSLSLIVDQWFDEVGIGQGFGGKGNIETLPECFRSGEKYPDFATAKFADEWKKGGKGFPEFDFDDGRAKASEYGELLITPKFDGWLGVLHYRSTGNFKLDNKRLVSQKQRSTRTGKILATEEVQCVLSTRHGVVMWDNHLTREFQRTCERLGIREAIVAGEIVTYDEYGKVAGPHGVTTVINRKEERDGNFVQNERLFNSLRFVLTDAIKIDGKQWKPTDPYQEKHTLLNEFTSFRITRTPLYELEAPLVERFDALWSQVTTTDGHEGFVVYAEGERFKVKRHNTLDAVIIGVDKTSKRWMDGKGIGSAYVAVMHNRPKYGPIYVSLGRVGTTGITDEQRKELTQQVIGEDNKNVIPLSKAVGKLEDAQGLEDIIFVEPTTVVEIVYETINPERVETFSMYREQSLGRGRESGTGTRFAGVIFARRMRSPRIVGIREDKNPLKKLDVDSEQGEQAGGFQIGVRPNPNLMKIPKTIKKALNDITWSFASAKKKPKVVVFREDELVQRSFVGEVIQEEDGIGGSIDLWRKLHKLMDRNREFAGFVKNNTIYYGSSHMQGATAIELTSDLVGVDFMFHTHPYHPLFGRTLGFMSDADIVVSYAARLLYGVEYQVISETYGFDTLRIRLKADGKLSEIMSKLEKEKEGTSKFNTQFNKLQKIMKKEVDIVRKAFRNKTSLRNKTGKYLIENNVAFSPFEISAATIHDINTKSKEFHIDFTALPLPVYSITLKGEYPQMEILENPMSLYGFEPKRNVEYVGFPGEEVYGLDIKKEFELAHKRAYAFDKPPGDQKMYLTGSLSRSPQSPSPVKIKGKEIYLDVSNLDQGTFATAIDDDLMEGQDAQKILPKYTKGMTVPKSWYDTEKEQYHIDQNQNKRDLEVQARVFFDMSRPKDLIKSEGEEAYFNKWFKDIEDSEEVLKAVSRYLTLPKEEKQVLAETLADEIAENPPPVTKSWDDELQVYIEAHRRLSEDYMNGKGPPPELILKTKYADWEYKILEKGRLLQEAEEKHSYNEEDIRMITESYPPQAVGPSLTSAFADLYGPGLRFDEIDEEDEEDGTEPTDY